MLRRPGIELSLVVVLTLGVRVAAFVAASWPGQLFVLPDSVEYDRIGWNLGAHQAYSLETAAPWKPDLTRTPVYPYFVASCYALAGHHPAFAVGVQLAFSVGTVLLVWAIGRRFFTPATALVAALLLALDPLSIQYACLLLSETLFTFLFLGALFCLFAYLRHPGWHWLIPAALLTGAAILCRPIAILWPLALLPGFLLLAWRARKRRILLHYGVFVAGAALLVAPWVLRNDLVGGLPVLTTVRGINLYYYRAAVIVAEQRGISPEDSRALLARRLHDAAEREHLSQAEEYRLMERWAEAIIAAAPRRYAGAHLRAMNTMFRPEDPAAFAGSMSYTTSYALEAVFLIVVYGLGLIGLARGLCGPGPLRFWLLVTVLVYFVVLSGPEAYARFRVPVMPTLALFAGTGVTVPHQYLSRFGRAAV